MPHDTLQLPRTSRHRAPLRAGFAALAAAALIAIAPAGAQNPETERAVGGLALAPPADVGTMALTLALKDVQRAAELCNEPLFRKQVGEYRKAEAARGATDADRAKAAEYIKKIEPELAKCAVHKFKVRAEATMFVVFAEGALAQEARKIADDAMKLVGDSKDPCQPPLDALKKALGELIKLKNKAFDEAVKIRSSPEFHRNAELQRAARAASNNVDALNQLWEQLFQVEDELARKKANAPCRKWHVPKPR